MPFDRHAPHRPSRSFAGAVLAAAALALPALPVAAGAASAAPPPPLTLPWHSERAGSLGQVSLDESDIGRTVAHMCAVRGPMYAVDVTSWTPTKSARVIAEQVTSSLMGRNSAAEANGFAVLAADGRVLACLTGNGTERTTFPVTKNATLRLVQFLQRSSPVLDEPWRQKTALVAAKLTAPTNDSPATATTLGSLPGKLKVDNRLATTSVEDWTSAVRPRCQGMWDVTLGMGRTLWYRYTPTTTQTVLLQPTSHTAVAAVAELTPGGLDWQIGDCALNQGPRDVIATLAVGHSYLISVGLWFEDFDHTLVDGLAPATVVIRRVVPNRKTVFISGPNLVDDGSVTSTVTCPVGGSFDIRGWVAETETGDVDAFEGGGDCTGGFAQWWAPLERPHSAPVDLYTVAVVTSATGAVTVVGPAAIHVG